jgi:hypothetical protein
MAVIAFRNNRGTLDVLSPEKLRRDMMILSNSEVTEIDAIDFQDASNAAILPLLTKLGISRVEITAVQVRDFVSSQLDPSRASILFAMSRAHFLALVYLLYSGAISPSRLSEVIDLEDRSRTQVILDLLPEQSYGSNIITRAFEKATEELYFKPSERVSRLVGQSYFDSFSLNAGPSTVFNRTLYSVPDVFFTVVRAYYKKLGVPAIGAGIKDLFDRWGSCSVWNCSSTKSGRSHFETKAEDSWFGTGLFDKWNNNEKEKKKDSLGLKQRFSTFYSYLNYYTNYSANARTLNLFLFHNYILNSYLPISAIRAFKSREYNRVDESLGFQADLASEATRRAVSNASDLVAPYSYQPSYFLMAYWLYNNTDSIATTGKDLGYWNTFLIDPASPLRVAEAASAAGAISFSYVSDPRVVLFLKKLFPVISNDSERNRDYISRLLLNSKETLEIPGLPGPIISTMRSLVLSSSSVREAITQVSGFDFLANDSGSVVSIGFSEARNYAVAALSRALAKANYNDSDVLSIDSYNTASSRISNLKANVVSAVLSQNGDPANLADFNELLVGATPNELLRVFVADIIGDFFDYLLNNSATSFEPVLSSDSIKIYRLLNFIKHTFINFGRYMDSASSSPDYLQYTLLVALGATGLNRATAYGILNKGSITRQDISGIIG